MLVIALGIKQRGRCNIHVHLHNLLCPRREFSALDCSAGSEGGVIRCIDLKPHPREGLEKQAKQTKNSFFILRLGNPIRVKSNSPESSSNRFICDATISLASGASGVR